MPMRRGAGFAWSLAAVLGSSSSVYAGGVPVDLAGGYFAGTALGSAPGLGYATSSPGGPDGQVFERSGGVDFAAEAHLTPFSDALKPPSTFRTDFAGRRLVSVLALGAPTNWQSPDAPLGLAVQGDFFLVGLGGRLAADDDNPEVWVAASKDLLTGEFAIELQTDATVAGVRYVAPGSSGQTRFQVDLAFAADAASASLRITPLDGSGSGVEVDAGTLPLDLGVDDLGEAGVAAGFYSRHDATVARATVEVIGATGPDDSLYLRSLDPYARVGEEVTFDIGMANLERGVFGFQAFLEAVGAPLQFASGSYTVSPFPNWIIDPITNALDLASGRNPGDPPTWDDAVLAQVRFDATAAGAGSVRFRASFPDSKLSDGDGSAFRTNLVDSNGVVVDSTPPTVSIVAAYQGANDILAGAEPRPGPVEIRVRAVDSGAVYSGLATPPRVRIIYPGTFGADEAAVSPGADDAFVARAELRAMSPCGPAQIEVIAEDDCGNQSTQTALFDASPLATVVPSGFTVTQGVLQSGNLNSLFEPDGDRIVIAQRYPLALTIPNARLIVEGTAPQDNPMSVRFQLKVSANAFPPGAFTQRLELFDWVFNAWRIVDQRVPSNNDVTINVEFFGIAGNLINDTTRQMLARISLFDRGALSPNYVLRVDRAIWRVCR